MFGVLQIKSANNVSNDTSSGLLKILACGLLLAATLVALPARAADVATVGGVSGESADSTHLSVVTEALPGDFNTKSLKVGLAVIEIERLEALGSDIVYIRLAENQAPDAALQALNAAFPGAEFERLEDGGGDFDLIDF